MLDFKSMSVEEVWPEDLNPAGEEFESWWFRNRDRLAHLDRRLVEQWVYRHWDSTHFKFIPLETLRWSLETWPTERVLSTIRPAWSGLHDPEIDYSKIFKKDVLTVRNWKNGTWDYPTVILELPFGVSVRAGEFPNLRFMLVEGHLRFRYLNALSHHRVATGPHELFVLRSPITSE
ncbi:hypothetical protein ACLESO_36925 [Pyxidicoccus sp. 3LG]